MLLHWEYILASLQQQAECWSFLAQREHLNLMLQEAQDNKKEF